MVASAAPNQAKPRTLFTVGSAPPPPVGPMDDTQAPGAPAAVMQVRCPSGQDQRSRSGSLAQAATALEPKKRTLFVPSVAVPSPLATFTPSSGSSAMPSVGEKRKDREDDSSAAPQGDGPVAPQPALVAAERSAASSCGTVSPQPAPAFGTVPMMGASKPRTLFQPSFAAAAAQPAGPSPPAVVAAAPQILPRKPPTTPQPKSFGPTVPAPQPQLQPPTPPQPPPPRALTFVAPEVKADEEDLFPAAPPPPPPMQPPVAPPPAAIPPPLLPDIAVVETVDNDADLEREVDDQRRHEADIAFTQRGAPVVANLSAAPGMPPLDDALMMMMDEQLPPMEPPRCSPPPTPGRSSVFNGGGGGGGFVGAAASSVGSTGSGAASVASSSASFYGLSPLAKRIYASRGVKKLYDWQHSILTRDDVTAGGSLVYSLPTSGGKTLVAEVLLLRCVTLWNKSAMFVLPYVSIAEEKTMELEKFAHALNFQVEGFYGVHGKFPVSKSKSIFVCTIEKANSLWNQLSEEGRCGEIGTIVVDELHMLGELRRGATLEMLLCKVLNFNHVIAAEEAANAAAVAALAGKPTIIKRGAPHQPQQPHAPPRQIQVIGMSATIPNLNKIAEWLGAACYEADFRPVPLRQFAVFSDGQVMEDGDKPERTISATNEFQCMLELCLEVSNEHSVLVFCASRQQTVDTAKNIAKAIAARRQIIMAGGGGGGDGGGGGGAPLSTAQDQQRAKNVSRDIANELRGAAQINEPVLAETMEYGVAFHHAGLLSEERNLIEQAFRNRQISILCCTSTLAAGVNLPARRVIFKTPYIGKDFLIKSRYSQMCGRAGRAGLDTHGEAFLILWKKGDVAPGKALMKSGVEPTKSVMMVEHSVFLKCVVESIASGVCKTVEGAQKWGASLLCNFIDAAMPAGPPQPLQPANMAALMCGGGPNQQQQQQQQREVEDQPLVISGPAQIREMMPLIVERALQELATAGLIRIQAVSTEWGGGGATSCSSVDTQMLLQQQQSGSVTADDAPAAAAAAAARTFRLNPKSPIVMTPFGSSGVRSCFAIEEAMMIRNELTELQEGGLILSDDLHICYFLTPVREIGECDWGAYEQVLSRMPDTRQRIAARLGVDEGFVAQRAMGLPGPPANHASSAAFRQTLFTTRRFFVALMLSDLLNEVPVATVEQKFRTSRGQIQSLMKSAAMFSSSITSFCNAMEWYSLEAVLSSFVKRLGYGVKPDLVPLMEIKGVQAPRARALWTAGFRDVDSIAAAVPEELVKRVKEGNPKDNKSALFFTLKSAMAVIKQATLLLNAKAREKLVEHQELSLRSNPHAAAAASAGIGAQPGMSMAMMPPPRQW